MADLTHGPVTAEMIPLLTPGRSVLLRPDGEARLFKHHAGNGQLVYLERSDAYWRRLVTYIGERDDDGWINAPKGGWKSNPVPGVEVFVRLTSGVECEEPSGSSSWGWTEQDDYRIAAFRLADPQPATPPAPADGLEVIAEVVSAHGDPEAFGEREIKQRAPIDRIPYNSPLVLKSTADAQAAELQAEIERLRGLLEEAAEALSSISEHPGPHACDAAWVRVENAKDTLTKIGEAR